MTYSILARDPDTGALGGAAATGSLCVGGWVLRGRAGIGISASQGASPSTLWGDQVLDRLGQGTSVAEAVRVVIGADSGRDYRQLSALDQSGHGAAFTGARNTPFMADVTFENGVAAGNLLATDAVISAAVDAYLSATVPFAERLVAALVAGRAAGSDSRGLLSAALLVVSPDHAPLSLRIDYADDPVSALASLYERATSGDYAYWARQVPTLSDPERALD